MADKNEYGWGEDIPVPEDQERPDFHIFKKDQVVSFKVDEFTRQ